MIIYQITNKVNGNFYIGKTTQPFEKRINSHKTLVRRNKGFFLHKAIRKYGIENFDFSILIQNIPNEPLLNILEKLLIENFKPKYNLTKGGEGTKGLIRTKNHSLKISKSLSGRKLSPEHCKKISEAKSKVTQETRQKISNSRKGQVSNRKGVKLSEETRKKMSESQKKRYVR